MVKIAVIGAGFMGRTNAEAYSRIELAQVAAVCDRDKALGEKFAEDFGCSFYEDFDTMAAECEFEVADICLLRFFMKRLQSGQQNMENIFSVRNRQP